MLAVLIIPVLLNDFVFKFFYSSLCPVKDCLTFSATYNGAVNPLRVYCKVNAIITIFAIAAIFT